MLFQLSVFPLAILMATFIQAQEKNIARIWAKKKKIEKLEGYCFFTLVKQ